MVLGACQFSWAAGSESSAGDAMLDQLVRRVEIRRVAVAPGGKYVAFLTSQGDPIGNDYEMSVFVQELHPGSVPTLLGHFRIRPDLLQNPDNMFLLSTAGQIRWSKDGSAVAFTDRSAGGMRLQLYRVSQATKAVLCKGFSRIEMLPHDAADHGDLAFVTTRDVAQDSGRSLGTPLPEDLSLLVQASHRFTRPIYNPKTKTTQIRQTWRYDWTEGILDTHPADATLVQADDAVVWPPPWWNKGADSVRIIDNGISRRYELPSSFSPSRNREAFNELSWSDSPDPNKRMQNSSLVIRDSAKTEIYRQLSQKTFALYEVLGWKDEKTLFEIEADPETSAVKQLDLSTGTIREIVREPAAYRLGASFGGESEAYDGAGNKAVLIRETNLEPDELVMLDLSTGVLTELYSPNTIFAQNANAVIRFISIRNDSAGAPLYGRLYLPSKRARGGGLPLVFTSYVSRPGFMTDVGDELPVFSLLERGIAVFVLHAAQVNTTSRHGDFQLEILRVKTPLDAIQKVTAQLAKEGVIDPKRVGIQGSSYGAEIAMYALWNSSLFSAVSVAATSWTPSNFAFGGLNYAGELKQRGFADPDAGELGGWRELAATLNARPSQAPILVQGADLEQQFTAPGWVRFKQRGCQIEWLIYPDEGHVKRNPGNKYWVYSRNLDWFTFWLQGVEDASPAKAAQYARWREMRKQWESAKRAL